jgi:hypothetical protein
MGNRMAGRLGQRMAAAGSLVSASRRGTQVSVSITVAVSALRCAWKPWLKSVHGPRGPAAAAGERISHRDSAPYATPPKLASCLRVWLLIYCSSMDSTESDPGAPIVTGWFIGCPRSPKVWRRSRGQQGIRRVAVLEDMASENRPARDGVRLAESESAVASDWAGEPHRSGGVQARQAR